MSSAAYANHITFMQKPKKKFANARQKHHYVHAARHYHSYRQEMKKKNYEKSEAHAHAFRLHAKAGKFTDWHRDQVQHDAKHFGEAKAAHFTPYRSKKMKGKLVVAKCILRKSFDPKKHPDHDRLMRHFEEHARHSAGHLPFHKKLAEHHSKKIEKLLKPEHRKLFSEYAHKKIHGGAK
jgi:hypothetical protein